MSAVLVASTVELAAVSSEWEDLAERTGATPFVRPGWVAAWWDAYGKGRLEIRCVRHAADGRLAALVPVRREGGVLGSPTNWHSPTFGLLAESDEAARAFPGAGALRIADVLRWPGVLQEPVVDAERTRALLEDLGRRVLDDSDLSDDVRRRVLVTGLRALDGRADLEVA